MAHCAINDAVSPPIVHEEKSLMPIGLEFVCPTDATLSRHRLMTTRVRMFIARLLIAKELVSSGKSKALPGSVSSVD